MSKLKARKPGNYNKWLIRKVDGQWLVYRPAEFIPSVEFPSFAALAMWKPDCTLFLNRLCHCRMECAR